MGVSKRKQRLRAARQKKSNRVTFSKLTLHKLNWLEWVAIGLSVWFLFYPKPYEILLGVLLFIPIFGLIVNGLQHPSMASLVEITAGRDGKDNYDVADFIDIPAWVILFRVLVDFEFESFYSLLLPGTIACAGIITILFLTHKLIENSPYDKWWIYSSLIFNVCLYSYAGTYAANCTYDHSSPTVYKTAVLEKNIRKGKSTSYHIKVAPWGHRYDTETITVSRAQYEEINVGETVNIDLKKGLFNIPWYFIERKPPLKLQ